MIKIAKALFTAKYFCPSFFPLTFIGGIRMIVIFTILILLVTIQNGFSNSSSAITGCVSARSMSHEGAVRLATVCTFLGSVIITRFNPRVTHTFFGIADFGEDRNTALLSLCAALCAVLILSLLSHRIGLPTSDSHALVSGLTGAALANRMSFSAIKADEWKLVILGFFLSTFPAFLLGFIFNAFLQGFLAKILKISRRGAISHFKRTQKWSAAWNAALHGAQDCQKFTGVYMLGLSLSSQKASQSHAPIPISVLLLCTAALTLGSGFGVSNVIKKVGSELCELDAASYSAASAAASVIVTLCTLIGMPADILQARACSVIGAGFSIKKRPDIRVVSQIVGSWLLTFPACMSVGFILSYIARIYLLR
jgi:PiT family inorganic phosphate transporter